MNQRRLSPIALVMAIVMIVMQPLECFSDSIFSSGPLPSSIQTTEMDSDGNTLTTEESSESRNNMPQYNTVTTGSAVVIDNSTPVTSGAALDIDPAILEGMNRATEITLDSWSEGLNPNGQTREWFKFNVPENGAYEFTLYSSCDMWSRVYNDQGETVWQIINSRGARASISESSLVRGKTYYVEMEPFNNESYRYKFLVNKATGKNEIPLDIDELKSNRFEQLQQEDNYLVKVSETGEYLFEVNSSKSIYLNIKDKADGITPVCEALATDSANPNVKKFKVVLAANKNYQVTILEGGDYDLENMFSAMDYTVKFTKRSSISVEDDFGNDIASAESLEIEQEKDAAIDYGGDVDYFKIIIPIDGKYTFKSTGNLDTFGTLLDSEGKILASNDDTNGSNFEIEKDLAKNQLVYLEARGFSKSIIGEYGVLVTGEKVILIEDDNGNDKTAATEITLNQDVTGKINYSGDKDYFKFTTVEEDLYDVAATENVNFKWITANDVTSTQTRKALLAGESTYLEITSSGAVTCDYGFKVTKVGDDYANNKENATPIDTNVGIKGIMNGVNDVDFFKVNSGSTGIYSIIVTPSNNVKVTWLDSEGNTINTTSKFIDKDQSTYVKIESKNGFVGEYSLTVGFMLDDYTNERVNSKDIEFIKEFNASIDYAGDWDYFKINIPENGRYIFRSTTSTDVYGYIYDAQGNPLASDDDSGGAYKFKMTLELKKDQIIYLGVKHYNSGSTGAYGVYIEQYVDDYGNDKTTAENLNLNESKSGRMNYIGDYDYFKFTASETGVYRFTSTGTTDVDGYLYLADGSQNANVLDVNDKNFIFGKFLEANQIIYIGVYQSGNKTLGDYGITATKQEADDHYNSHEAATALTISEAKEGKISYPNDWDYFAFKASKAGKYSINVTADKAVQLHMYNTALQQLENSQTTVSKDLAQNEILYLAVKGNHYGDSNTTYSIAANYHEFDVPDIKELAQVITAEEKIKSRVDYYSDTDCFKFVPPVDGLYTVEYAIENGVYAYVQTLSDSNIYDNILGWNNYVNVNKKHYMDLKKNQVYYFFISGQTSNYEFALHLVPVDDHSMEEAYATELQNNVMTDGNFDSKTDVDSFKFTPSETGMYVFESFGNTNAEIFETTSTNVYTNDVGLNKNFYLDRLLEAGKTYYYKVYHNQSGDVTETHYQVKIYLTEDKDRNTWESKQTLTENETYTGKIDFVSDYDYFTIPTFEKSSFVITMESQSKVNFKPRYINSIKYKNGDSNLIIYTNKVSENSQYDFSINSDNNNDKDHENISPYTLSYYKDNDAPSQVKDVTVKANEKQIELSWEPSIDATGVEYYQVFRNGQHIGTVNESSINNGMYKYLDTGLAPNNTYKYDIKVFDILLNAASMAIPIEATTNEDKIPPTVPSDFRLDHRSGSSVTLTWANATDNIKVDYYEVYKDGVLVGTVKANDEYTYKYTAENLEVGTPNTFTVKAVDTSNNASALSSEVKTDAVLPKIVDFTPDTAMEVGGSGDYSLYVNMKNEQNHTGMSGVFSYKSESGEIKTVSMALYSIGSNEVTYRVPWNLNNVPTGEYNVKYELTDETGHKVSETALYFVDRTAPNAPSGLSAESKSGKITLVWKKSPESDLKGYKIYRSETETGKMSLVKTIENKDAQAFNDTTVELGKTYYYSVSAYDKYNQEGNLSEKLSAVALNDTVPPVMLGIEPIEGTKIGRSVELTLRAEDDLKLKGIKLSYSKDNVTFTEIQTIMATGETRYTWVTPVENGTIYLKAVAIDTANNESTPEVRVYNLDTTGPEQVENLTVTTDIARVVLKWQDVSDQDLKYFQVEMKDSEAAAFKSIGTTSTVLGYEVTGLTPNHRYWFRVVAYDQLGNRGTASETIEATTTVDKRIPVVTNLSPKPSAHSKSIDLSATAADEGGISNIKLQVSTDKATWNEIASFDIEANTTNKTVNYKLDLTNYNEGSLYFRAIAMDRAGNTSDSAQTAPFVEYKIDKTAPTKPTGAATESQIGVINVQWAKSNAIDLSHYNVYRKLSTEETFKRLSENVRALSYNDLAVEPEITYDYYVTAVDFAGNESEVSETVSAKMLKDTVIPKVFSLSPGTANKMPKSPTIKALVADNYRLKTVKFEYRKSETADAAWTLIVDEDIQGKEAVAETKWNNSTLENGKYDIRVTTTDFAGNVSESLIKTYEIDVVAPKAPVLSVAEDNWTIKLNWTASDDEDLGGYRVYRAVKGESFRLLEETKEISFTEGPISPNQTYVYRVESIDRSFNVSSSQLVEAKPLPNDIYKPKADAGVDLSMATEMEFQLDATLSKDNDKIVSYLWDFGDGITSKLAKPKHIYKTEGSYTVKLTVKDAAGNEDSDDVFIYVYPESQIGTLEVKVVDEATGQVIPDAIVYADLPKDVPKHFNCDYYGKTKVVTDPGKYGISAYKTGYLPVEVVAEVKQSQTTNVTIRLKKGELVVGEIQSRRLTLEEMVEKGIDVSAPENQNIFNYTIHLEFDKTPINLNNVIINSNGSILSEGHSVVYYNNNSSGSGSSTGVANIYAIPNVEHPEVAPTIAVLDIPQSVSWLKEFFEVGLIVENKADEQFYIQDAVAKLNLPKGLSLAKLSTNQSETHSFGTIGGQESKVARWIVKGDEKGEYALSADFKGNLMPFNSPVKAQFESKEKLTVKGGDALAIEAVVEDGAYANQDYHVQFRITNTSNAPVYNLKTTIGAFEAGNKKNQIIIKNADGTTKVLENSTGGFNYIIKSAKSNYELPILKAGDSVKIETIEPGESVYATFVTHLKETEMINGNAYFYKLVSSSVIISDTSNSEIPVNVTIVPSEVLKTSKMEQDSASLFGDSVDTATGAQIFSKELLSIKGNSEISVNIDYNSKLREKGEFGQGFSHNFEMNVTKEKDGSAVINFTPSNHVKFMKKDQFDSMVSAVENTDGTITVSETTEPIETTEYRSKLVDFREFILREKTDGTFELELQDLSKFIFDKNGKLVKIQNDADTTTLTRTASDLTITDDISGRFVKMTYNEKGLVKILTDSANRKVEMSYDENDRLISYIDISGVAEHFTYDEKGLILTARVGDETPYMTNTYDKEGRVETQDDTSPDNELLNFKVDDKSEPWRKIVTVKDRNGYETKTVYNRKNQLVKVIDALGNVSTSTYDANGNKTSDTDALGNTTIYEFDVNDNLVKITDPEGHSTVMTYDERHNLLKRTNANGEFMELKYDDKNRTTACINEQGIKTTYTYDADGHMTESNTDGYKSNQSIYEKGDLKAVKDQLGNTYKMNYDDAGRIKDMTNPKSKNVQVIYDESGNVLKEVDEMGHSKTYVYNDEGQKISEADESGNVTKFSYDGNGNITEIIDPKNRKSTYVYDGEDRLLKSIDVLGRVTETIYDPLGRPIKEIDAAGNETLTTYDAIGNVLTVTRKGKGQTNEQTATTTFTYYRTGQLKTETNALGQVITYYYDPLGRLAKTINAKGKMQQNAYDKVGNLIEVIDELGNRTEATYNSIGEKTEEKDKNGNITKYEYNANGSLTAVIDPLGNRTTYKYDALGRTSEMTDANGKTKKMTYDDLGRMIQYTDALGRSTKTDYNLQGLPTVRYDAYGRVVEKNTYNALGQLTVTEDALGNQNKTVYDEFGRLEAVVNELNQKTTFKYNILDQLVEVKDPIEGLAKQTFDQSGRVTSVTDTNGSAATYEYDILGQLVKENMAIGGVKTYTYDSAGLMERMKNARNQETEYTYDDAGRITELKDAVGTIAYTYDANGNILTVTDEKGTATRTFDALDRMTSYTDYRGNTVKYSYDSVGNLIALTYPGGKIVRYAYDAENQLTTVTDWSNRVTKYEYDLNGRLTKTTRPNGTSKTVVYDAAGLVTSSKDSDKKGKIIVSYEYTYNKKGQITEEKSSIKSFGENVQKTVMTYTKGNQLETFNGQKVKFDADGNMTYGPLNGKMTTYEYDARNRLIKVGDTTYEYDAENHRIASTTGTLKTEYLIDPSGALTDVIGIKTGKDTTLFINGNGLIAQEDSKGNYHTYHYDYRGSTVALTDKNGNTTDQMVYGTYGELLKHTGTTKTPFLYSGRDGIMTDSNGLYYMRARFYNPELKRFVNQDVLTGTISDSTSLNRFSYVNGDPVGKIDPSGNIAVVAWLIKAGIGGVTDLLMQVTVNYYFNPQTKHDFKKSFNEVNWWQVARSMGESLIGAPGGRLGRAIVTGAGDVLTNALNAKSRKRQYTMKNAFTDFSTGIVSHMVGEALASAVIKYGKNVKVPKGQCKTSGKDINFIEPPKCFVAGTLISTKEGLKPIETIKEGDYVYAENPETGEKGLKQVVQTFVNEKDTLVEVVIGDTVIKTTEGHPFWIEGGGWLGAEDLKPGDRVRLESGAIAVVQSVQLIHLKTPVKVYNFEVEDFHTYYVSELKVLVHNTGCGGGGSPQGTKTKNKTALWDITKYSKAKLQYNFDGKKITAYQDNTKMGYWWAKDTTAHGGSTYKVFKKQGNILHWLADADEYGNFILDKHKGQKGLKIVIK